MPGNRFLTASRLKDARACRRLHHLEYDLGYRPVEDAEVLRFGTLMHRGLEALFNAMKDGAADPLASGLAAMVAGDPFDIARAQVLLTGYWLRWKDEPLDVLAVEVRFDVELRNPGTGMPSRTWRLAGKIDLVVRDRRDGLVYVVEHKTSAEDITPGSDYWKRLRMDGQVSVYFEGGTALGYEVAGCIYDVLGKSQHRPGEVPLLDEHGNKVVLDAQGERVRTKQGKWRQTADSAEGFVLQTRPETPEEFRERLAVVVAENPSRFFARGVVVRLEGEMADAMHDVWQLGQELREAELAGRHPRNPDACVRYGRTCPFFAVCTGEASLDDPTRFTRIADVHPELAGSVGDATPKEEASVP